VIYDVMRGLQAKFTARLFPTAFLYGPPRFAVDTVQDHWVVIERDHDVSDQLSPANGVQQNPRRLANRKLAAKATIYARSNLDGARINEHEAECEQIVDAFVVAFSEWGAENLARLGGVGPSLQEMRYLKQAEFHPEAETWPGVVYVVRFQVTRAVIVRNYESQAQPTAAPTGVENVIEVRLNGVDPPELVPPA
jgi:hypothetical protein